MLSSSLVLPAHGNAPYLIGIKLLRAVTTDICLPEYYDNQRSILKDEFSDIAERIFLSKEMGTLLNPLLRDKDTSLEFNRYVSNVRQHIDDISKTMEANYREGIDAISLSGTRKKFSKFDVALNTGLPIFFAPPVPVFFAFVGKMSAIYDYNLLHKRLPTQSFNATFRNDLTFLAETWREIEKSFSGMFIPRLNSLYKLEEYYDRTGITFTPPFAQPYDAPDNTSIPHGSILIVTSGTRLDDEDKLRSLVASSPSPYVTLSEFAPNNRFIFTSCAF